MSFQATGSLIQGNVEAHLVFCLIMSTALTLATADPAIAAESRATWWYWLYVDDCILLAPPHDLHTIKNRDTPRTYSL